MLHVAMHDMYIHISYMYILYGICMGGLGKNKIVYFLLIILLCFDVFT